jgi:hypothetical protein
VVAVVELARHVHVLAVESRGADRLTDAALVAVHLGGVDVSVAGLKRGIDRARGVLGWDLKDAKAQLRDRVAVVESDRRDDACAH